MPRTSRGIHYETRGGEGPRVLMLMGLGCRGRGLDRVAEALGGGFSVALYDHAGVGESAGPARTSMAEQRDDALSVLDALGWDRAHVVGVSMGGMASQHLALDHKERVQSLTLTVTTPRGFMPPGLRELTDHLDGATSGPDGRLDATARLLFSEAWREQRSVEQVRQDLGTFMGTDRGPIARHLLAVARHDTRDRIAGLASLPCQVLGARHDRMVPTRWSRWLAETLRAPLTWFESGHGVVHERPEDVARAVAELVARADQRGSTSGGQDMITRWGQNQIGSGHDK